MQEHLSITDPEAARALTDTKGVQLLVPFMKRPHSLSDAARELGVKLPKLSYHVKRFLTLGLLEVTCSERRNRRSVKLYRSTAKSFFIPFHITSSETLEGLVANLTAPETGRFRRELARTLQQISDDWGLNIARNEHGNVSFAITQTEEGETSSFQEALLSSNQPAIFSSEGRIFLDFGTAKAFQRELSELGERYAEKQSDKGKPYAFRLGLTPMQDDSLE